MASATFATAQALRRAADLQTASVAADPVTVATVTALADGATPAVYDWCPTEGRPDDGWAVLCPEIVVAPRLQPGLADVFGYTGALGRWVRRNQENQSTDIKSGSVTDASLAATSNVGRLNATKIYIPAGTSMVSAQASIDAMSGVGEVYFGPGTHAMATNLRLKPNLVLAAHPNASFVSSLTPSTWAASVPFIAYCDLSGSGNTTLAATPTLGARTVSSTASVAANTWILIGDASASTCGVYQVLSVSGSGPYTLTLDREVWVHFTSGDTVLPITTSTLPQNIRCYFNGATLTGTGLQAFAYLYARNCFVEGLRTDTSTNKFDNYNGIIFNDGAYNCAARDCIVDGLGAVGATVAGHWIANSERCRMEGLIARRLPTIGFRLNDAIDCTLTDCLSHDNTGTQVLVTSIRSSSSDSIRNRLTRVRAQGGGEGIGVDGYSKDTILTDCAVDASSAYGIRVYSTAQGTIFRGVETYKNGSYGMRVDADVLVQGWISDANVTGTVTLTSTANLTVEGFSWGLQSVQPYHAVHVGTGRLVAKDGRATVNASSGSASFYNASTGTIVRDEVITGGRGGYYSDAANGMLIDRGGVDDSACTVANVFGSGQQANYGTIANNGTTGVTTNYRGMKATSQIVLSIGTVGGTPSPTYISTVTAGTSFATKASAGDTSTVIWKDASA